MSKSTIRTGIGGWNYAPWRGLFYPEGLPQAREFRHAVEHMGAIEINATFYGRQKPASWEKWARDLPPGFRFAIKGSRYVVTRKSLADAGEGVTGFLEQGLTALGPALGPILWQFDPRRKFDADDIAAFLALLPDSHLDVPLQHVLEPRHDSFADPRFAELCAARGVSVVFADDESYPCIDATHCGPVVYARLQRQRSEIETGYAPEELDLWAARAREWAATGRDVYVFMINGAKERAPAAATALAQRLQG